MSAAENKEMIRNMWAELSKGNAQGFLNNFADNCRITIIGASKFSGTWTSKQAFVSYECARPSSQNASHIPAMAQSAEDPSHWIVQGCIADILSGSCSWC
ncbi:MAG TPA: hypothetical protein VGX03_28780 [Candidatus Binatia bacterium]|jgi:hypothetical protein|nr:hypothetical protein [Candidatus Binatia bacterium]